MAENRMAFALIFAIRFLAFQLPALQLPAL
jgi:hypothetical protein